MGDRPTITILMIFALAGLIWMIVWSIQQAEKVECYQLQKQSYKYPGFYLADWQKQQCDRWEIEIEVEDEVTIEELREGHRRTGYASWYARGLINPYAFTAASTEFERGTRLLVVDSERGNSVEVVINDYGPDPVIHPDRIIDLSLGAFREIADPSLGIIFVEVKEII